MGLQSSLGCSSNTGVKMMFQAFLARSQSTPQCSFFTSTFGLRLVPAFGRSLRLPPGSSDGGWWGMVLEGLGSPSSGCGAVMVHLVKEGSYHLKAGRGSAAARRSTVWEHVSDGAGPTYSSRASGRGSRGEGSFRHVKVFSI